MAPPGRALRAPAEPPRLAAEALLEDEPVAVGHAGGPGRGGLGVPQAARHRGAFAAGHGRHLSKLYPT